MLYILTEDRFPESAWAPLAVTPPVVITGEDETLQPAVTLESTSPGQNLAGSLDQIWGRPGAEVTVEVRGAQTVNLAIKVDRKESFAEFSFSEPFQLITEYVRVSGITGSLYQADSLTYRVQLPKHSPIVEGTGQPDSLVLILTIAADKSTDLFSKGGIPVTTVDFTRQNPKGEPETTLVKAGEITYPDYPKIDKVLFKAPDFIGLDRLEKFSIDEIAVDPEHKGIQFRLNGIAGHVMTGSRAFPKDHRLTLFDTFLQNTVLMVLISIVVWVLPTTVGGYNLYKEVKR